MTAQEFQSTATAWIAAGSAVITSAAIAAGVIITRFGPQIAKAIESIDQLRCQLSRHCDILESQQKPAPPARQSVSPSVPKP